LSGQQPTLVMVSGLGGDERLFEPQRSLPWPIHAVKWLEPHRHDTLASYSQRLAAALTVAEPFFLGGVSMGGMMALEMSRWLRPEAVLLIASARSGRVIYPFWRVVGRVIGWMPISLAPVASRIAKMLSPAGRELNSEQRRFCLQMASDAPPRFVRWACRAVVTWPGVDLPRAPVYHIHGDRDPIIPVHRVKPDHIVRGGGHMINLTHAEEVNAYLREKIEKQLKR